MNFCHVFNGQGLKYQTAALRTGQVINGRCERPYRQDIVGIAASQLGMGAGEKFVLDFSVWIGAGTEGGRSWLIACKHFVENMAIGNLVRKSCIQAGMGIIGGISIREHRIERRTSGERKVGIFVKPAGKLVAYGLQCQIATAEIDKTHFDFGIGTVGLPDC